VEQSSFHYAWQVVAGTPGDLGIPKSYFDMGSAIISPQYQLKERNTARQNKLSMNTFILQVEYLFTGCSSIRVISMIPHPYSHLSQAIGCTKLSHT
jgi:hypothetical protein